MKKLYEPAAKERKKRKPKSEVANLPQQKSRDEAAAAVNVSPRTVENASTVSPREEWQSWSDRKIAEVAGVSNRFVGNVRDELCTVHSSQDSEPPKRKGKDGKSRKAPERKASAKKSDRQIAEHVGVGHVMVSRYRQQLESTVSLKQSPERTGRDGRTINTANIGKRVEVEALEALERPKAKERQGAAGPKDGPGKKSGSVKFSEPLGTTRDKVGAAIGMSGNWQRPQLWTNAERCPRAPKTKVDGIAPRAATRLPASKAATVEAVNSWVIRFTCRRPCRPRPHLASLVLVWRDMAAVLGERLGVRIARSDDYRFLNDQTALRAVTRYDFKVHEGGTDTTAGVFVELSTAAGG